MITYKPLEITLKKKKKKKTDLLPYMSSATLAKLGNDDYVSMKTINTICKVLECKIEDVALYIEEGSKSESKGE